MEASPLALAKSILIKIQHNIVCLPFPDELTLNASHTMKSHNKKHRLVPSLADPYN